MSLVLFVVLFRDFVVVGIFWLFVFLFVVVRVPAVASLVFLVSLFVVLY